MIKAVKTLSSLLLCFFLLSEVSQCGRGPSSDQGPTAEEMHHDFGFVGMDYVVKHLYPFVNRSTIPIRITDTRPSCQCTSVLALDSLVNPNDTVYFRAQFDSKDFYGVVNKTFTVSTDCPGLNEIEYSLTSVVGHWVDGLKPDPISVFFLPKQASKSVTIYNPRFAQVEVSNIDQYDDTFETKILTQKAHMKESLEIEVVPRKDLPRGTYLSNLTLSITKKGYDNPTLLTIPVKIVRY